jgi:hypothetical protein
MKRMPGDQWGSGSEFPACERAGIADLIHAACEQSNLHFGCANANS